MTPPTPKTYSGPDRRVESHLSDEQIDIIAEKAAERAVEKMTAGVYKSIGKSVVDRFFWIVGALSLSAWLYAKNKGWVS